MPQIKVRVKTGYGELEVSGGSREDVIEGLAWLTPEFMAAVSDRASEVAVAEAKDILEGIVRVGRDGPIIVTREELSHYESIGLILYSVKGYEATGREIKDRLATSGKKITVAARLHEMRRRGHVFQPEGKGSKYKLSMKGIRWIEEDILSKLGRD